MINYINDISTNIDVIQRRVVSLVTNLVRTDTKMLHQAFRASLTTKVPAAANYILAMGNVMIDDDFNQKFENGRGVIFATIIAHIDNPESLCRQAALRLVCLSGQKQFFTGENFEANIPITSESPAGYVMQSKKFIRYMSKAATTDDCVETILLIANDFAFLEDQQERVIPNIALLVQRVANDSRTLNQLLCLTSKVSYIPAFDVLNLPCNTQQLWKVL